MFSKIVIVAVLAAFAAAHSTTPSQITVEDCPSNLERNEFLKTFGQTCYRFERDYAVSHDIAVKGCNDTGGRLATIKSAAVNDFLKKTLRDDFFLHDAHTWIGLNYNNVDEQLYWSDGTRVEGYNMVSGSPSWHAETCGALSTETGKWVWYSCLDQGALFTETHTYICEYAPKE